MYKFCFNFVDRNDGTVSIHTDENPDGKGLVQDCFFKPKDDDVFAIDFSTDKVSFSIEKNGKKDKFSGYAIVPIEEASLGKSFKEQKRSNQMPKINLMLVYAVAVTLLTYVAFAITLSN